MSTSRHRRRCPGTPFTGWLAWALGVSAAFMIATVAGAQDIRPSDERIALPPPEPRQPTPVIEVDTPIGASPERAQGEGGSKLPPLDELLRAPPGAGFEATSGDAVEVDAIRFVGNTALSNADLARVAAPWLGRRLGRAELRALRDALTLAYVDRGYVTSGAEIAPGALSSAGVLEVEIVEGVLERIVIENEGRLRDRYVRARLERGVSRPLDLSAIETALARLQRDRLIKRVAAVLQPGDRPGESILQVTVEEADPWDVDVAGANTGAPPVGQWRGSAGVGNVDLTGFGDAARIDYEGGAGLQQVSAAWSVPVTRFDTRIELSTNQIWSRIVEEPLADFDITSRLETYRAGVSQPLLRSESHSLVGVMRLEWRVSETFLDGEPFSFVPGPRNGRSAIMPLRMAVDWTWQSSRFALAMRNQLSVGLPAWGVTRNEGDVPDARFVSWLAQLQMALRMPIGLERFDPTWLVRFETQLATDRLLAIEQYALGGLHSVRGIPANSVVRDNGLFGSLELRQPVPLPRIGDWRPGLEMSVFADGGRGWNHGTSVSQAEPLLSLGVGARFFPAAGWLAEIYWAQRLAADDLISDPDLQERGVYMSVSWRY